MNETLQQLRRHLREMWHRRWIGLAAAWLAALISVAIVYRIPERWEASARVFVDTESLLRPLLAGLAIQPNVDQQVALISRTLISRPNVERVVRMADLDIGVDDQKRDDLIEAISRSIKLTGNTSTNLYVISYLDADPEQARRVVQSLLTIFESSRGDKRQDSRTAVRFLDEQIKHYEQSLNVAENRLKEFRLKYLGITGRESGGDYVGQMGELSKNIAGARLALSSAEQSRDAYKRELAGEQPAYIPDEQPTVSDAVPELDNRLTALRRDHDELSRRYTNNHPDVVATKRLIGELENERKGVLDERRKAAAAQPAAPVKALDRNPVFQQLRLQLADAEAQVAAARARLQAYETQLARLQSQAKLVPQVDAEFAQLNRDYDVQKKTYEQLLQRRESATMGIGVQDTSGAQFRVIDPPRVSPKPAAPNRPMLLGIAFLISLGAGLIAAFVTSQAAPTFHDGSTLRDVTNRPVLGLVSVLPSPSLTKARRRRTWLFAGGVSGLFALFAGVVGFALFLWRVA